MEMIISCCGLNCPNCDARIATMNNDNELRKTTAEKWKVGYNALEITPAMINGTGCREEGVKFNHCVKFEIRNCVKVKGLNTCGKFQEMETCNIVSGVHKHIPDAKTNLRDLN